MAGNGDYLEEMGEDEPQAKGYIPNNLFCSEFAPFLPLKSCSPNWWYNDSRKKQSGPWLHAGYKTINAKSIPLRKGVEFEQYPNNARNMIMYNRKVSLFLTYFFLPLIVTITVTFIFNLYNEKEQIKNTFQSIQISYNNKDYNQIKTLSNELIPKLIKWKEFKHLCYIYTILYGLR